MEAEGREGSISPRWFSYVSFEDTDATASRAHELGDTVYSEAFTVLDSGRMAVIYEPTGAVLAAWELRAHIGADRVNDPSSCLTCNELQSRDPETAATFYAWLFGCQTEPIEEGEKLVYVTIKNAGFVNGGSMPTPEQHGDTAPYQLPWFTVLS